MKKWIEALLKKEDKAKTDNQWEEEIQKNKELLQKCYNM